MYTRILLFALIAAFVTDTAQKSLKRILIFERLTVNWYNKSWVEFHTNVAKINRTTKACNTSITVYEDMPEDVMLHFIVSKMDNGQYKETAIQIHKKVCDFLAGEYQIMFGDHLRNGFMRHFLQKCPIKAGYYYFRDSLIGFEKFPIIPLWRIKAHFALSFHGTELGNMDAYVEGLEVNE